MEIITTVIPLHFFCFYLNIFFSWIRIHSPATYGSTIIKLLFMFLTRVIIWKRRPNVKNSFKILNLGIKIKILQTHIHHAKHKGANVRYPCR